MSSAALYNIGHVARVTGVPAPTIRAWERRYGFPEAERTSGHQRVYSAEEIDRIHWVKARVDEGMQAGKAVQALRRAIETGEDLGPGPAIPMPGESGSARQLGSPDGPFGRSTMPAAFPGGSLDRTAGPVAPLDRRLAAGLERATDRLTSALVRHDADEASAVTAEALSVYPIELVALDVLRPALAVIGELWCEGRVSVATEHFASNFVRQRLDIWLATAPPPRRMPPLALACAPGEWHDIGLLMLGLLLVRRGWPVAYLGQAVPLPDLVDYVGRATPSAVVVAATSSQAAQAVLGLSSALQSLADPPPLLYGGPAFAAADDLQAAMGGLYLGDEIATGVGVIEAALGGLSPLALREPLLP